MPKPRPYYVLLERNMHTPCSLWSIQFGDYSRNCVMGEMRDRRYNNAFRPKSERLLFHILSVSSDNQVAIDAAVIKLNYALLATPVADVTIPRK